MTPPSLPGALLGIDVSHWQAPGDWTPTGLHFVIARATNGTSVDERYAAHVAKARKAGLRVGAYHFNGDGTIARQAEAFLRAAGAVDLYALDVEGKGAFTRSQAAEFVRRVQAAGHRCGLYMSESAFWDVGQDWDWVANWGPSGQATTEPKRHWDIWQYGNHRGEDGDLVRSQAVLDRITGGAMATAVNGGARIMGSDYVRDVPAGTVLYRDTSGTRLVTLARAIVLDDFGIPAGTGGWAYVYVSSAHFDADADQERGLALVKVTDVGPLRRKTAAELEATARRFAAADCADAIDAAEKLAAAAVKDAADRAAATYGA
ncbi:MAG: glycoside hydrolase family 25 protein [Chloroflexota bacterium]